MPSLNFQAQFAPLVESGAKRTTIRALRRDGRNPKRGDPLYMFTGQRTRSCRRLVIQWQPGMVFIPIEGLSVGHIVECKSARAIHLEARPHWRIGGVGGISIAGRWLGSYADPWRAERNLVRGEGFADVEEMIAWFAKTHGLPFKGILNSW